MSVPATAVVRFALCGFGIALASIAAAPGAAAGPPAQSEPRFAASPLNDRVIAAVGPDAARYQALMDQHFDAMLAADLARVEELDRKLAALWSDNPDGDPVRALYADWHRRRADDLARVRRDPALVAPYEALLRTVGRAVAPDAPSTEIAAEEAGAALERIDSVRPAVEGRRRGVWYEQVRAVVLAVEALDGPPGAAAARRQEILDWNDRVRTARYPIVAELVERRRDFAIQLFREGASDAAERLWFDVLRDAGDFTTSKRGPGRTLGLDATAAALACAAAGADRRKVYMYGGMFPVALGGEVPYDPVSPADRVVIAAGYLYEQGYKPESRAVAIFLAADKPPHLSNFGLKAYEKLAGLHGVEP